MRTYYDEIYRFAYRQLGHKEDAMDLTQTIFLAVLRALPSFDGRKASFRTWLYRIAAHKAIDCRRKVQGNIPLLEETGQIQKVPSDDSRDHYDADISCHPHFVCTCCHRVLDLKMDDLGFLNTLASQGFDGEILRSQLTFYGLCGDCKCSKSET